LSTVEK